MTKILERESSGSPENLAPIEIGFGYEFYASRGEGKFIIIDVDEGNYCAACGVTKINGKEALGIAGTTTREDIGAMTGKWSLDRILKALMNQFNDAKPSGKI